MTLIPNIPESLSRTIYADLCTLLPPPEQDTPEDRANRDERAMTALAHLLPENAAEAEVAVLIVAAQAHARDALHEAAAYARIDPAEARRCRAQVTSMMRQAANHSRILTRMQAERQKAEDALRPLAMERSGYWFKSSEPEPEPEPRPAPETTQQPPRKEFGAMTEGERYATLYADRAIRIIAARGLPAKPTFQPPDPEIVHELLTSTSPIVRALDQRAHGGGTASQEAEH